MTLINAIEIIKKQNPKQIFVIVAIASEKGMRNIAEYDPSITVLAAAIDPILNDKGYIVPGLCDAGDRCYGEKSSQKK